MIPLDTDLAVDSVPIYTARSVDIPNIPQSYSPSAFYNRADRITAQFIEQSFIKFIRNSVFYSQSRKHNYPPFLQNYFFTNKIYEG
jgi:hypothetical protein